MSWLLLGPLVVHMEDPDNVAPWPSALLGAAAPAEPPRWGLRLRLRRGDVAGDGTLRWRGGGYEGPGFRLRAAGPGCYEAEVAGGVACMGALAAALIDQGEARGFGVAHAATLEVAGRGVLVTGFSGAGKSTLAARHPRRTLGANAALVWPEGGFFHAFPLPITGHGDDAIRPREVRLAGALCLGEPREIRPERAVLRWLASLATALGRAPPLDLALGLARALPLRGWGCRGVTA